MNLIMRGILAANIVTRNGDTLEDDWPYFEDEDLTPLISVCMSTRSSNSSVLPGLGSDGEGNRSSLRVMRFRLKLADYAFLLHDLYHLKSDGIMAIVLPHGVLFRGGEEARSERI